MFPKNKPTGWLLAFCLLCMACSSGRYKEEPVSDAEAKDMGVKIEMAMKEGHGEFIDKAINPYIMAKRIHENNPGEKESKLLPSELRSILQDARLGVKIKQSLGENGTYRLVRQYAREGRQHLLFRLYSEEGFNYHDFELVKNKGKVGIADLFIYLSGENFSETIFDLYRQLNKIGNKGNFSETDKQRMEKLEKCRRLMENGRYAEAVETIKNMPENWRRVRIFSTMKVMAASRHTAEAFEEAVAEYRRFYPNDHRIDLVLIDGYLLQKRYDQALTCIDNLDRQIEGDPFLDYERGLIQYEGGNIDSALYHLENVSRRMPDFQNGHTELIALLCLTGKIDKAQKLFAEKSKLIDGKARESLEERFPILKAEN